jgi:hypothetical protein
MPELITSRRSFITGLAALVAAPAIVRAGSLMPVKAIQPPDPLVRGIRYQTWPFGQYQPGNDYWSGSSWMESGELRPISYFIKRLSRVPDFDRLHIRELTSPSD